MDFGQYCLSVSRSAGALDGVCDVEGELHVHCSLWNACATSVDDGDQSAVQLVHVALREEASSTAGLVLHLTANTHRHTLNKPFSNEPVINQNVFLGPIPLSQGLSILVVDNLLQYMIKFLYQNLQKCKSQYKLCVCVCVCIHIMYITMMHGRSESDPCTDHQKQYRPITTSDQSLFIQQPFLKM